MPYMREGNCVYHKNSDGSKGKKMGCSDSPEGAKRYMRKLYMEENKSLAQFSMVITKASVYPKAERTMRLSMVNSDTNEDVYEERMSVELFKDFVERIEKNAPVPKPFDEVVSEDGWEGGMPYLSISHYRSGKGNNIPGEPENVYVDGERLKSHAVLYDNPLGLAVWKSICQDIDEREKPIEERAFENPVRISIGFLDLQHKHEIEDGEDYIFTRTELKQKCPKCEEGINGKVYLKGQLVHLAFTRVPANPRTQVEVLKMSDEILTKKDDAESIIGDLAEELVGKSTAETDEALVVKAEESRDQNEMEESPVEDEKPPEKLEEVMEENQVNKPVQEEVVEEPVAEVVKEEEKSKIDLATEKLKAKVLELKSQGITGEDALKAIQPIFNEVGAVVKEEMASPMDGIAEVVRSAVAESVQSLKAEIVAEVLKALPEQKVVSGQEVPAPRSITVQRSVAPQDNRELTQIQKLALQSTQPR